MNRFRELLIMISIIILMVGCSEDGFTPKPRGYLRFEFPEHQYNKSTLDCPFEFDYPIYANVVPRVDQLEPCWFNVQFPQFKAKLHFSYKPVSNNLNQLIEDSRSFVYKHAIKASNIDRRDFQVENENVYATYYKIDGNAASAIQFTLTDSSNHFLRGALYFEAQPNEDSLSPALTHLEVDINRLIQSLRWK